MAPNITLTTDVEIEDPQVKAVARRVLATVQLAGEKAVANMTDAKRFPLAGDARSYERILRARLDERPEVVRATAKLKIAKSLKASPAQRQQLYGPLAKLNLGVATPVEELAASIDGLPDLTLPRVAAAAPAAGPVNRKLSLRLRRVRCIDETNGLFGSEAGSDEIVLGATTIDEDGDTKTVTKFDVGDFDDGDVKRFSPPRRVTFFNVREGGDKYPKSYYVTLVLAEEDMGGTAQFLDKLADKLEEEIRKALTSAGSQKGPIGVVVAMVLAWVVGKIFDWFSEAWGDEIFKPRTAHLTLHSPTSMFSGGKLTSTEAVTRYKGHGGEYELAYDWVIAR
jgi:hypothetical protein